MQAQALQRSNSDLTVRSLNAISQVKRDNIQDNQIKRSDSSPDVTALQSTQRQQQPQLLHQNSTPTLGGAQDLQDIQTHASSLSQTNLMMSQSQMDEIPEMQAMLSEFKNQVLALANSQVDMNTLDLTSSTKSIINQLQHNQPQIQEETIQNNQQPLQQNLSHMQEADLVEDVPLIQNTANNPLLAPLPQTQPKASLADIAINMAQEKKYLSETNKLFQPAMSLTGQQIADRAKKKNGQSPSPVAMLVNPNSGKYNLLFLAHLRSEFATDNVHFIQASSLLTQKGNVSTSELEKLYNRYIRPGSKEEINIDYSTRHQFVAAMQQQDYATAKNLLPKAVKQIIHLLSDATSRFNPKSTEINFQEKMLLNCAKMGDISQSELFNPGNLEDLLK